MIRFFWMPILVIGCSVFNKDYPPPLQKEEPVRLIDPSALDNNFSISGRLPGPRWREVDPPRGSSLQTLQTIDSVAPCLLQLYVKPWEQSVVAFMEDFASRLAKPKSGIRIQKEDNLRLENGLWLNFSAFGPDSTSRVFAMKRNNFIIWVLFSASDEGRFPLFAPDAEKYVGRLSFN